MKLSFSKLCFLLVAFTLGNWFVSGQTCAYSLRGKVIDLHDSTPIYGALVSVEGTDFFSQTDEKGNYLLEGLCYEQITISVEHPQCISLKKEVKLLTQKELNFQLEHHINELEEIILSESQLETQNASVKEARLSKDQISQYSSESISEALSSISGVSLLQTGNTISKPIIHGMFGSRVGIVANGVRLRDQEWGADHAPSIDLNAFEGVQVIKGAATLKYGGDTAGGMIVLTPSKKMLQDSLYGATTLNLESNGKGGSFQSKMNRTTSKGLYIGAHLTARRFGDFQAPNYNLSNTGLEEGVFSLKFGKTKVVKGWELNYSRFQNQMGILRASHIGNIQDLLVALNSDEPLRINPFTYVISAPKQEGIHQNLQFSYYTTTKNNAKWQWEYSYQINQRKEYDVRRAGRSDFAALDLKLQSHTLLGSYSWENDFEWKYEWGINGLFEDNFSNPNTGVKRLIPDYTKYELGTFFVGVYKPTNLFSWDWGLRLDGLFFDAQKYYDLADWEARGYGLRYSRFEIQNRGNQLLTRPQLFYFNLAAQTGISFAIGAGFETKLAYILSQRAPNASELFSDGLHHSLATIEYGNLDLKKETTHKVLLSFSKAEGGFSASVEPYFSFSKNYIYIAPQGIEQTIRGAFPVWNYFATDVLMAGFDSNLEYEIKNQITLAWSTSYIYGQDLMEAQPLILIPPFNSFQKIKYTSKKRLWDVEIAHQFVGQQGNYPDFDFTYNTIEMGTIVPKKVEVSAPPKGYNKWDVFFSIYLSQRGQSKSYVRLVAQNLTNTDYRNYLNRLRFFSSELGRNFQLQLVLRY